MRQIVHEEVNNTSFSPRITDKSAKLFNSKMANEDINDIFDHLNKDTELRKQKQAQKMLFEDLMSKNMASQGIQSINVKSTIMMAAKFEREFMQAALYISRQAKASLMNLGPINSVADLFEF